MTEMTYPPAGADWRALSTSRPCPGYCVARVGATARKSRSQSVMVSVLGRSRRPLSLFLFVEAAVTRDNCHMLHHVHSVQARERKQLSHKVIRRFLPSTLLTREEICQCRLWEMFLFCSVALSFANTQYNTRINISYTLMMRKVSGPSRYTTRHVDFHQIKL
jgi:hypothetical protein